MFENYSMIYELKLHQITNFVIYGAAYQSNIHDRVPARIVKRIRVKYLCIFLTPFP